MSGLKISNTLTLPLDAVTETFAILAVKRSGKSNAAVVMAEEMYDAAVPWVAIDPKGDWWGVRAAGDGQAPGLSVLVFGGLHGDVPLEPSSGRLVADLVVQQRITCVLDVSEMTKADQRRFLIDFADRLYRTNTEPLHVFCEEADEYIPQRVLGETAKLVGVFETLVKRGGFRGIGITLITQRSASLNKDVLTQAGTLIAMRTPSPQDRKAVLAWIDYHDTSRDVIDQLPSLNAGEAWVFSPQWLRTLEKIRFRRRRTFDSGATPKVGERRQTPTLLADVDLDAIKTAMADTIERAKADDPKALRARIRDLERQVSVKPEPIIERVEVPVLAEELVLRLETVLTDLQKHGQQAVDVAQEMLGQLQNAQAQLRGTPSPLRPTVAAPAPVRASVAPRERPAAPSGTLGKTERAVLTVLVIYGERTHRQIALQTGYSPKASTIGVSLSKLRKMGYVEPNAPIRATPEGVEALGDYDPLPTGPALLSFWQGKLGKTENKVLDHLLGWYPSATDLAATAEATGYSPQASTIGVSMSKLRKLEIADGWRLSDDFARSIGIA